MRILALAAVLLVVGCSSSGEDPSGSSPVALVSIAEAAPGQLAATVSLYGSVDNGATDKHVLTAPAEARVVAIDAPVGTPVHQGQIVARLAPGPTVELDTSRAVAEMRAADQAYARAVRLRADGLGSNAEVDSARATAATAHATLASLSARTRALDLRAGVNGYVESLGASPGDLVAAGASVATIVKVGELRARFGVDPALARRLTRGSPIRITPAGAAAPFTVPILSVDPVVDPQTRLASVFASIPAQAGIGPGEALTGMVAVGGGNEPLTIPYSALLNDGGQPYVFVVSRGIAHRREVTTGASSGDRVAIIAGLKPGERVVTEGGTALEDGMKVRLK